jgi:5-carboxymethyl-2-hydroxymuconic-semialdehyde dehydrogenase
VLNVVHGYGKEAGEPLCRHPDVRAISFTGSTATGNRIVKARGLKKFSMELGGKSPFVIFDDADLDARARRRGLHDFLQQRRALHRGLAHPGAAIDLRDFVEKFAERAKRITVGDPLDEKTIIGPMISPEHLAKVRRYIELGPKEGATLLCGGVDSRPSSRGAAQGQFRQAHRVRRRRQPHAHRAGRDLRAGRLPDSVQGRGRCHRAGKRHPYGLSSYVWSENIGRAHRVAAAIEAGMCFVNSQNVRDLRQPFGGTKASGTGREGGTWSYEVFWSRRTSA